MSVLILRQNIQFNSNTTSISKELIKNFIKRKILEIKKKQIWKKKCYNDIDSLLEGKWYDIENFDERMSKNVQNIRRRQKLHLESHEKQENGINNRKNNSNIDENLMRLFVITVIPLNYLLKKDITD